MSQINMFNPKIKLEQQANNQKFLDESISFCPEFSLELESFNKQTKMNEQQLMNPQNSVQGEIANKISKSIKTNTKKFLFNQFFSKAAAQTLIKNCYVLTSKFKNHKLLQEEYLNNKLQQIQFRINKFQNYIPIINYNNKILYIWEIWKLAIYLYLMWIIPFKGAFMKQYNNQFYEIALFYIMVLDVALQLNKEIIEEGQLISDRATIIKCFIKKHLSFELIYLFLYACITHSIFDHEVNQILNIGFFFFNLRKFQCCIKYYQESSINTNDKINLAELIVTVLILAHFMSCIWFYIGTISLDYYSESWILKLNLQNEQIFTQYCYSFYWAATTMATVGYGDITAQNLFEIICSTSLILFSSGIFAFSINSIGMILNNMNQNGQVYKRNLLLINQYMTQNYVDSDLQMKIRNYLQFYYSSTQYGHQKDVNIVIEQLSQNLKLELVNQVRCKVIKENPFISKYFSDDTKQKIIEQSEPINYSPLEEVYQQNSCEDCSIYIIQKGSINLIHQNSGRIVQEFSQGDSFGELEFLTGQPRYLSSYSVGFSQVLKISREKFIQIIKQNQQDFQQFHQLKDQINFKTNSPTLCSVCQESHILFQCDKIFYKPNIEKLLKAELFHTFQSRQSFVRSRRKNTYLRSDIRRCCQDFRIDNEKEDEKTISRDTKLLLSNARINRYDNASITYFDNISKEKEQQFEIEKLFENVSENENHKNRNSIIKVQSQDYYQHESQNKNRFQLTTIHINHQSTKDVRFMELQQFSKIQIDQQYSYRSYFPKNNIKNVIRLQEKIQKNSINQKSIIVPSKYRFFQRKIIQIKKAENQTTK